MYDLFEEVAENNSIISNQDVSILGGPLTSPLQCQEITDIATPYSNYDFNTVMM